MDTSLDNKVIAGKNNFENVIEIKATFTADNVEGTAALSPFHVIPGVGVATAKSLPSGVTYSGDFASYADFIEYMKEIGMRLAYIRIQTSDAAANFNRTLSLGERKPNLQNNPPKQIRLTKYRESNGSGIMDTLTIDDLGTGVIIWNAFYMLFDGLKKNTDITFYLGISHWEVEKKLEPIS